MDDKQGIDDTRTGYGRYKEWGVRVIRINTVAWVDALINYMRGRAPSVCSCNNANVPQRLVTFHLLLHEFLFPTQLGRGGVPSGWHISQLYSCGRCLPTAEIATGPGLKGKDKHWRRVHKICTIRQEATKNSSKTRICQWCLPHP